MADLPLQGFITKKDAAERYDRSHRSLTRDLSAAVRTQDADVLPHLRLRTDDGEIREGTDVTLDMIQDLSNRGLTPTWYLLESWVREKYGEGGDQNKGQMQQKVVGPETAEATTGSLIGIDTVLRERIRELEHDKEELREELKIKNEQIKEANSRTRESNVLMQELQKMLGSWQERAFQSLPAAATNGAIEPPESATASTPVPTAKRQQDTPHQPVSTPSPTRTNNPITTRKKSPQTAGKRTSPTKRRTSSKRPSKASSKENVRKQPSKAKWYEMPTVKHFLGRK